LQDKDGKIIPAGEFMPSAERVGFAQGLDRWVLLKSLKVLSSPEVADRNVVFFIKLTAGTLQKPEDFAWYKQQILSHSVEASRLVFEIKSDTLNNYIKSAKEFVDYCRTLGCKLAIDDFGSTTDAFQLSKHLQPEFLKIGGNYSREISSNNENKETVKSIIEEAHKNKQQVIVQHIEDAQQLTILWGMNANYVQGNFLQAPSETMEYDFGAMIQ
jgi:EAL domain-containing protein (putative c-di-GMP-specific phosphodiesterase class I)